GQFVSANPGRAGQDQWETLGAFSKQVGRHHLRTGFDFVRLEPFRDPPIDSVLSVAPSLQGLLDADPLAVTYSNAPRSGGRISTLSLFAQDTVRLGESINVVYGLRWEVTPPTADHVQIPTVSGLWTGTDWKTTHTGDITGTAPWPMRYGQV